MQQTPETPPPPPEPPVPPVPPDPGAVVAGVMTDVNGVPTLVPVPRSAEQVQGLRARVDEIQNQLERAHDQRQELLEQLQTGPSPDARPGIEQQLRVVDARILQLEQNLSATNQALTGATPEAWAQAAERQRELDARRNDNDEEEAFFGGSVLGVFLTLTLVGVRRFWRRRGERRRGGVPVHAAGEDPRIDRLSQAVDAIAVEVERIGEGQRFVTQLLAEERDPRRLVGARTQDVVGERHR